MVEFELENIRSDKGERMKNKSKLNKIKQKVAVQKGFPKNWFYMNAKELDVDRLKDVLADNKERKVEVWKEAGVLEIELPEEHSIDFEQIEADLRDEYSNEFLTENGVKTLFTVSIDPEHKKSAEKIMQEVIAGCGGFFCGDTEDFTPVIRGDIHE